MSGFDLTQLVNWVFNIAMFLVLGRALLSWFDPRMQSSPGQLIFRVTEPFLAPIRNVMPKTGTLDLSPIILIIALQVVKNILINAIN